MIEFLKIENLALLERAEIDFRAGFTAVTGETGAGKSVLLGALSMLAGARTGRCSFPAPWAFQSRRGRL